jgi:sodium-dependent dicarboxylate transporter 2/3/5
LAEKVNRLGKVTYRELSTAGLILGTICLWVVGGDTIGLATISLLAVVAAFVIGCTTWTEVEEDVNWGIVLMYGGALALGMGMLRTGASEWLAHLLLDIMPTSNPIWLLTAMGFVCLWLTEAISNAAVVALFMPPVLGIAQATGIDPRLVALFVAIPCGYAMVLPMGTPAMALAFSGGFLRQRDTVRLGALLKMVALALFVLFALTVWPMLGLEV